MGLSIEFRIGFLNAPCHSPVQQGLRVEHFGRTARALDSFFAWFQLTPPKTPKRMGHTIMLLIRVMYDSSSSCVLVWLNPWPGTQGPMNQVVTEFRHAALMVLSRRAV